MKEVFSKQSEFERFYRACVAFAKSYTYDDATAESIASEAMLVFWEKQKTLDEDVPALPYLLGIARNLIRVLDRRYLDVEYISDHYPVCGTGILNVYAECNSFPVAGHIPVDLLQHKRSLSFRIGRGLQKSAGGGPASGLVALDEWKHQQGRHSQGHSLDA